MVKEPEFISRMRGIIPSLHTPFSKDNKIDLNSLKKLIDQNTGAYLYDTLRQCHHNRVISYSRVFNVVVVLVFVSIAIAVLYWCFYRKRSPSEEREKLLNDQKSYG